MSLADESPHVLESREGGILTLTLNRGSRFNPLSRAMIDALDAALVAAAADSRVRVIVLAGAGRGFSAGHDLKEMRAHAGDAAWQHELFGRCNSMMQRIPGLPVPVIARVHGIATAAGCQLVSMCDLAVAAETATFALPGVNIGVFCSTPAVGVARNVARKHVMEMLLTGDAITAPADQLDATVQHYAVRIAARSRKVIGLGKQTFYAQSGRSLESAYELAGAAMACNLGYEDAIEGMDAFLGKRAPEWHDR